MSNILPNKEGVHQTRDGSSPAIPTDSGTTTPGPTTFAAAYAPAPAQAKDTTVTSVRNDTETTATTVCAQCGAQFTPVRRRRWCSDACRQSAWRQRQAAPLPTQPAKIDTVYECPQCQTRYLGTQRCEDCNTWCRRVGPGGPCARTAMTLWPSKTLSPTTSTAPGHFKPAKPAAPHAPPPAKVDTATKWGISMSNSGQLG